MSEDDREDMAEGDGVTRKESLPPDDAPSSRPPSPGEVEGLINRLSSARLKVQGKRPRAVRQAIGAAMQTIRALSSDNARLESYLYAIINDAKTARRACWKKEPATATAIRLGTIIRLARDAVRAPKITYTADGIDTDAALNQKPDSGPEADVIEQPETANNPSTDDGARLCDRRGPERQPGPKDSGSGKGSDVTDLLSRSGEGKPKGGDDMPMAVSEVPNPDDPGQVAAPPPFSDSETPGVAAVDTTNSEESGGTEAAAAPLPEFDREGAQEYAIAQLQGGELARVSPNKLAEFLTTACASHEALEQALGQEKQRVSAREQSLFYLAEMLGVEVPTVGTPNRAHLLRCGIQKAVKTLEREVERLKGDFQDLSEGYLERDGAFPYRAKRLRELHKQLAVKDSEIERLKNKRWHFPPGAVEKAHEGLIEENTSLRQEVERLKAHLDSPSTYQAEVIAELREKLAEAERDRAAEAWAAGDSLNDLNRLYTVAKQRATRAEQKLEAAEQQWRCFHCGDVFTDEESARDHFGETECAEPACTSPLRDDETARLAELQAARREVDYLRKEAEEADNDRALLASYKKDIGDYFGDCGGVRASTPRQAWLKYEALEGDLLVARDRATRAEQRIVELIDRVHEEEHNVTATEVRARQAEEKVKILMGENVNNRLKERAEKAEQQLDAISKMPEVRDRSGVGDGSVRDAVTALQGALICAERQVAELQADLTASRTEVEELQKGAFRIRHRALTGREQGYSGEELTEMFKLFWLSRDARGLSPREEKLLLTILDLNAALTPENSDG
jgi:hypothetical protein